MQQILSIQSEPGMILAKDVQTEEGRILCGKGTALTENLIDRLQKMDISHITVTGHPVNMEGEKSLSEELRDIDARFSDVHSIPPLMYIKKRIMKKLIDARS